MGRFSIVEKLADGSAVDVLLGQEQGSSNRVLLEAVRDEVTPSQELMQQLLTEATQRRPLQHPNLSQRLRIVVSRGGKHYWVSEAVQGGTLRAYLEGRKGVPPEEALRLMLPLCEAVGYLHDRGYVHGNICPEYVLVEQGGGELRPKLVDSGLSLFRVASRLLRSDGRVLVKPEYLAPERIQGQRADALSDIYALGVLLFELLTGKPPFHDEEGKNTRHKHLTDPLPRLPGGLDYLEPAVRGCLAKQRAARFQSAGLLKQALDEAERHAAPRSFEPPRPPPGPANAGDVIGSYRVVEKLGEGAAGQVYLARHRHIERSVAIKVLRPEHALQKDMVSRFFQEAKAANLVKHPHIAEVYDFADERTSDAARSPSGRGPLCYLVMEYLHGETLGALMQREKLPIARAVRILRQVCDALGAAHASGVVHRDVKPENIFLVKDETHPDFVKLVDFGIAKLTWGSDAQGPLTVTGEVLGTPAYMAPEQLSARTVDGRTDIYAVGTVLYRILSGRRPFTGALGQMLLKLTREPPDPLPSVTAAGEPLPSGLTRLILWCLEKDPSKRPQTMAELSQALLPWEQGARAERPPPTPFDEDEITEAVIVDEPNERPAPLEELVLVDRFTPVAPEWVSSPPKATHVDDVVAEPALEESLSASTVVELPKSGGESAFQVSFPSRRAALSAGRANGASLTLFIPSTAVAPPAGTSVRICAYFRDSQRSFEFKGVAVSSVGRHGFSSGGFTLSFEGEEKRRLAEMLAFCADKPLRMGTANSQRFDVSVPCRVKLSYDKLKAVVLDLSRTGAFVASRLKGVRPGDTLEVQLDPGILGLGGTTMTARVVWKGNKRGRSGFGIRFANDGGCDPRLMSKYGKPS